MSLSICFSICETYCTLSCKGYHRNGKSYCSSHRIHEEVLDAAVKEYVQTMRVRMAEEQKELKQKQKMWALRKPVLDAHILSIQKRIQELEQEIDAIVMEKVSKISKYQIFIK